MPVHSISPNAPLPEAATNAALKTCLPCDPAHAKTAQVRTWCTWLEAGGVLYFPQTPVPIAEDDLRFLLGHFQTGSRLHKNIAYKPGLDQLTGLVTGFGRRTASEETVVQLRAVMRRYSASVSAYLTSFLVPYQQRWQMDYASYRPVEEHGRNLPLHRRNDLLHTDAFPTRPTYGRRILRFFHNIHPTRTRDWVLGESFEHVVNAFAPTVVALPKPDGPWMRTGKRIASVTGVAKLAPRWKRTPYDEFMRRLHNAMKEDENFQQSCAREDFHFAPGSSWMVYTDTVPHAVTGGQFALEQTFLVDPAAMVTPESAPLAVLERMSGARLV